MLRTMHSSSGKSVPIGELAKAFPPEIIWWMIARRDPIVTIPFDPVTTLFEEARLLRDTVQYGGAHKESAEVVKSITTVRPSLVAYPLEHLVVVAQLAQFDPRKVLDILRRTTAYANARTPVTSDDLAYIKNWLSLYGGSHRLHIRKPGEPAPAIQQNLRTTFVELEKRFAALGGWNAEAIHNVLHDTAKDTGANPRDFFVQVYRRIIGQDQGPKLGWLLETLGRKVTLQLL